MTLTFFKSEAERRGNFFDNGANAIDEWAKTWGLSWWRSLWRYKEYRLGNLTYRSGNVVTRHCSYSYIECEINGERVSPYSLKNI